MKRRRVTVAIGVVVAATMVAALPIRARFERELAVAAERSVQGSAVVSTRRGPIEVQQAG